MTKFWGKAAEVAKAIAGAGVAGVTYLMGVIPADTPINAMFADLTAQQWGGLALALAGAFGVVYTVPNRVRGDHEA